jgi:hypothetical protein
MRAVYRGVVNPRTGETVFSGFAPGSEEQVGILMSGPAPFPVATTYMQDVVFKNPNWNFKTFDYDKDLAAARDAGTGDLDVPSDGIAPFLAGGGKLLLSHGWSDGLIPAPNTVAYYKAMLEKIDANAASSVRLFMVPGMQHCAGGDAPFMFDALSIIDAWADKGTTPERIEVSRPPGTPAMSRPLCPYPKVAKYKGTGSTDEAGSFDCLAP